MINLTKSEIFVKYEGNYDYWFKDAINEEKSIFLDNDWSLIETIIVHLSILKKRTEEGRKGNSGGKMTFREMTDEEVATAHEETTRFSSIVVNNEYEDVMNELRKLA